MKALIFSEGNGYGHAARDRLISGRFKIPIMTFGKGAEYCKKNGLNFIEIPAPYVIQSKKRKVTIATNYAEVASLLKPEVLATISNHLRKVDTVIVDGSPLGLAIAMLSRKKALYITNDISALVGVQGMIQRRIASSLQASLLRYPSSIIISDFPPPLTVSMLNLATSLPLTFCGPLVERPKQVRHKKRFVVAGPLEKAVHPLLGDGALYGSDVEDLNRYYEDAELVISHGGHTTAMEALSHGKPLICIVDPAYPERVNNALTLERLGVGVMLDKGLLNKESLEASIGLARTLHKERLALFATVAKRTEPMAVFDSLLNP